MKNIPKSGFLTFSDHCILSQRYSCWRNYFVNSKVSKLLHQNLNWLTVSVVNDITSALRRTNFRPQMRFSGQNRGAVLGKKMLSIRCICHIVYNVGLDFGRRSCRGSVLSNRSSVHWMLCVDLLIKMFQRDIWCHMNKCFCFQLEKHWINHNIIRILPPP